MTDQNFNEYGYSKGIEKITNSKQLNKKSKNNNSKENEITSYNKEDIIDNYDVIIIGAGPAGMFAALELAKTNANVLLVDKGNLIENRQRNEVMNGFGGAGTFSDGKLHFTPVLSHEKMFHLYHEKDYQKFMDEVEKTLIDFGTPTDYYPKDPNAARKLVEEAQRKNVKLFVRKAVHVGSDKLPIVMKKFQDKLKDNGINFMPLTEVADIVVENEKVKGIQLTSGKIISSEYVIATPGRYNAKWLQDLAHKYELDEVYDKIEVGVRVEFPYAVLEKHANEMYETVFSVRTKTYDDLIRTFCPCPRGHVAVEEYDGFVCVNGHSNSTHDSENSNFAFVTEVSLTEPLESTRAYANFIAQGVTLLGSGKPIIQRLKDLKKGRRSTKERIAKANIRPTLNEAVPGDIGMSMPYRVVKNIIEGIEALDKVLPGLDSDSTFLYGPEVKFRSNKLITSKGLETNVKGFFVAGDGAGVSGNIVGAAVTGLIAGREVANQYNVLKEQIKEKN
jgi:uncharacterized FAD-dependent dehydrogenase